MSSLREDLVQVVLDGARADEQLGADLRVREPVAGEPGDLRLLGGELVARLDGALAHGLAGGQQLARGRARRTPRRPSRRTSRGRCAAARARRRAGARGAAIRRRAGGRGRARRGRGCGRAARSPRGRAPRRPRPRSAARASAPRPRAPSRCRWRGSSPRAARARRQRARACPLRAAASTSSSERPGRDAQLVGCSLARSAAASASLVAAEAVVEHRARPLGERQPDPLAARASTSSMVGLDQLGGLGFAAPPGGEQQRRRTGASWLPGRLGDRVRLLDQRRGRGELAGEQRARRRGRSRASGSTASAPASRASWTLASGEHVPALVVPQVARRCWQASQSQRSSSSVPRSVAAEGAQRPLQRRRAGRVALA